MRVARDLVGDVAAGDVLHVDVRALTGDAVVGLAVERDPVSMLEPFGGVWTNVR